MVNFIALGSYSQHQKHLWLEGDGPGPFRRWVLEGGMWTDDLITPEHEEAVLRAAREWEEKHGM